MRTYDMMRIPGGAKAISQGAASTVQMTDAVLAKLDTNCDAMQVTRVCRGWQWQLEFAD